MNSLLDALRAAVGPAHVLVDADLRAGAETDWTGRFSGTAVAVVRPADVDATAAVLRACATHGAAVVPQGGNTGLVGGSVPRAGDARPTVVLSTRRMTQLGEVDRATHQVVAGAGTTLADVQQAARAAGLAFGVDLAARDSATVGGAVATNAGGLNVIAYGPMRAQVLGLEAVLADGSVVRRLEGPLKDNTGYDLSALLVGSEGTLGVVTAARLRLVRPPAEVAVALVGVADTTAALDVLADVRALLPVLAAEVMYADGVALVQQVAGLPQPLAAGWPAYVLVEVAGTDAELAEALAGSGAVGDAALGRGLWAYRERHTEAINTLGVPHKLDVAVAPRRLPELEVALRAAVAGAAPDARLVLFGHVGDGNLHVNVVGPPPDDETVDAAVVETVLDLGGSISAEHGIGVAKARWLTRARGAAEVAAMLAVKRALDPHGILNPGVLFPG